MYAVSLVAYASTLNESISSGISDFRLAASEWLDLMERKQRGALEQGVGVRERGRQPAGGRLERGGARAECVRERDHVRERLASALERAGQLRDRLPQRSVLHGECADRVIARLHQGAQLPALCGGRLGEDAEVVDQLGDLATAARKQVAQLPELSGRGAERPKQVADVLAPAGGRLPERGE